MSVHSINKDSNSVEIVIRILYQILRDILDKMLLIANLILQTLWNFEKLIKTRIFSPSLNYQTLPKATYK